MSRSATRTSAASTSSPEMEDRNPQSRMASSSAADATVSPARALCVGRLIGNGLVVALVGLGGLGLRLGCRGLPSGLLGRERDLAVLPRQRVRDLPRHVVVGLAVRTVVLTVHPHAPAQLCHRRARGDVDDVGLVGSSITGIIVATAFVQTRTGSTPSWSPRRYRRGLEGEKASVTSSRASAVTPQMVRPRPEPTRIILSAGRIRPDEPAGLLPERRR